MTSRSGPGAVPRRGVPPGRVPGFAIAALLSAGVLASAMTPARASAAGEENGLGRPGGWGGRAGFSSDPAQGVVGLHYDAGEPARRIRFVPNLDLGVGDHRTVVTVNPDLVVAFPFENAGTAYAGGSCGVVWVDRKRWVDDRNRTVYAHQRKADLGVAGIVGYRSRWAGHAVFADVRFRITDAYPGVKLMVGMNLGT